MRQEGAKYILTFHGLGNPSRQLPQGEDHYWLDPAFFNAILDLVTSRTDVLITFDDSNSSDYSIALPELLKRKLTATFFLVSGRTGMPGFLTEGEIRELASAGMKIGSHGTLHRQWATLNATELDEELSLSKEVLEQLIEKEVTDAACPMGSYNRTVLRALKAHGYSCVYTSDQGPTYTNDWPSARNTIVRGDTINRVKHVLEYEPSGLYSVMRNMKLLCKRWR